MERVHLEESDEVKAARRARRSELIDELRSGGTVPGIAVGEKAPEFTLPNQHGEPVSLRATLGLGPVVLVFYRGSWCPICDTHVRALQRHLGDFRELGATLLAVSPQRPEYGAEFADELELGFDVLSDVDQAVIAAYRLQFLLPDDLAAHSAELGHPIEEQNADGTRHLPVPGTFVIDSSGVVRESHVDPNWRHRMAPEDVLEALRSLGARHGEPGDAA